MKINISKDVKSKKNLNAEQVLVEKKKLQSMSYKEANIPVGILMAFIETYAGPTSHFLCSPKHDPSNSSFVDISTNNAFYTELKHRLITNDRSTIDIRYKVISKHLDNGDKVDHYKMVAFIKTSDKKSRLFSLLFRINYNELDTGVDFKNAFRNLVTQNYDGGMLVILKNMTVISNEMSISEKVSVKCVSTEDIKLPEFTPIIGKVLLVDLEEVLTLHGPVLFTAASKFINKQTTGGIGLHGLLVDVFGWDQFSQCISNGLIKKEEDQITIISNELLTSGRIVIVINK